MARKSAILIPAIIAAVAVGGLGIAFLPPEVREPDRTEFSKGTVKIDDNVITVEIADTAAERQRWLTFRQDRLANDTALLLKYDEPDLHQVWTLNIEYNLDLVWLDRDGNVVYMIKNAPPCQNVVETVSCTYKTTSRSLYVMAATAGFIDAHSISKGSKMTIISI
ncbi:MAG TPA: DUF192 domain-containing protein [Nitrososphaera sp.]|jgi:uncharacterized protein|nr:DUF192 domain-containing protein [Nitrososphaera sp.]